MTQRRGRPPYTKQDYIRFGTKKGLILRGLALPPNTRTPTYWECIHCGLVHRKSLHAVNTNKRGCRCHNPMVLTPEDYQELAHTLGIKWDPERPRVHSTAVLTYWRTKSGKRFTASYKDLAYRDSIPKRVMDQIGDDHDWDTE